MPDHAPAPTERLDLAEWRARAAMFQGELARVIVGQDAVIRKLLIAVLARGHVLLEGDVGVGKTTLLRALARALGGPYARIEGTIDLLPTDMLYNASIGENGKPRLDPGPALAAGSDLAVFFFNEINRARPQVHALLLRMMAERTLNAFSRDWSLPHVLVFADRNRLERDETFELPAAARDRFFMEIQVSAPRDANQRRQLAFDPRFYDTDALVASVEEGILDYRALARISADVQTGITTSSYLETYVVRLADALRHPDQAGIDIPGVDMARLVRGGVSPRGVAYLARAARVNAWLDGRNAVLPEDIECVFDETMLHRVFLEPLYETQSARILGELREQVFAKVPVP